jgi:metal-responsive CopG/Arc/MetJ family transcriptional regulator
MANTSERVTLRLKMDQVDALDTITIQRDYKNRSHAIRTAIENFINENNEEWNAEKIIVQIPKAVLRRLDEFIETGDILSRQEGIRTALVELIKYYDNYYIEAREKLQKAREKVQNESEQKVSIQKS